jgi:hypothetical protein
VSSGDAGMRGCGTAFSSKVMVIRQPQLRRARGRTIGTMPHSMNSLLSMSFRVSAATLRASPFRTFLSTLGIVIGVASLVAVLSLGDGMQQFVRRQVSETTDPQAIGANPQTSDVGSIIDGARGNGGGRAASSHRRGAVARASLRAGVEGARDGDEPRQPRRPVAAGDAAGQALHGRDHGDLAHRRWDRCDERPPLRGRRTDARDRRPSRRWCGAAGHPRPGDPNV